MFPAESTIPPIIWQDVNSVYPYTYRFWKIPSPTPLGQVAKFLLYKFIHVHLPLFF